MNLIGTLFIAGVFIVSVFSTESELVMSTIEECMRNDITGRHKASLSNDVTERKHMKDNRAAKKRYFSMHFGDAGVETFAVLGKKEERRITDFADCLQRHADGLHLPPMEHEEIPNRSFHGGSNVTYLTGLFQQMLPTIHMNIMNAAASAVSKAGNSWPPFESGGNRRLKGRNGESYEHDIWELGVRSVQYVTFEKEGLEEYKASVRIKAEEAKQERNSFVIYPSEEERKRHDAAIAERMHLSDPDTDQAVWHRVRHGELLDADADHDIGGTVLIALVMLSERQEYSGGDVLALRRTVPELQQLFGSSRLRTDESDETGWEEEDANEDPYDYLGYDYEDDLNSETLDADKSDKFSSPYSELSRFTPERGSLMLIHGAYGFGTAEIRYGTRKALVIEFWQGPDAPVGITRGTLAMKDSPHSINRKEEL